jgi:hypothetical protein
MAQPRPQVPNTISDKQMHELRERARKASPWRTSICDPRAVVARKADNRQRERSRWN